MGYKNIRLVGILSVLVVMVLLGTDLWQTLGPGSAVTSSPPPASNRGVTLAFMFLSSLAMSLGSILKFQAEEIDSLKRRLAERQSMPDRT